MMTIELRLAWDSVRLQDVLYNIWLAEGPRNSLETLGRGTCVYK